MDHRRLAGGRVSHPVAARAAPSKERPYGECRRGIGRTCFLVISHTRHFVSPSANVARGQTKDRLGDPNRARQNHSVIFGAARLGLAWLSSSALEPDRDGVAEARRAGERQLGAAPEHELALETCVRHRVALAEQQLAWGPIGHWVVDEAPIGPAGDERVADRDELERGAQLLDERGVSHGESTDSGKAFDFFILALRGPDNIQLELSAAYT